MLPFAVPSLSIEVLTFNFATTAQRIIPRSFPLPPQESTCHSSLNATPAAEQWELYYISIFSAPQPLPCLRRGLVFQDLLREKGLDIAPKILSHTATPNLVALC